jgi:alcohol dehydrogenase class IV
MWKGGDENMNFKYYMPTKIITGENCIVSNSNLFKEYGEKALIVTGKHSAKINGSEADVILALEAEKIAYVTYDKVISNPTVESTYEGALIAKENQVDFIIAIGGGSPMDAAKGIALLAAQKIVEEELFSGSYENKVLPLIAIPTTAGTGSEVTQYSILTNDRLQTKTSIATELIFPKLAFLDAKYMDKLSVTNTINTAIDALSHAVEGMLSVRSSVISNALAIESIALIMAEIPVMKDALEQDDRKMISLKVRENLLQASVLAGMVIAQTGTTVVHAMGYSLTYFKGIDHGRANGMLLGEYLIFVQKKNPKIIEKILQAMNMETLEGFIESMNELFGKKEILTVEECLHYSKKSMQTKNIANSLVQPEEEDLVEMYQKAFAT